jgi:hypothetical protein
METTETWYLESLKKIMYHIKYFKQYTVSTK